MSFECFPRGLERHLKLDRVAYIGGRIWTWNDKKQCSISWNFYYILFLTIFSIDTYTYPVMMLFILNMVTDDNSYTIYIYNSIVSKLCQQCCTVLFFMVSSCRYRYYQYYIYNTVNSNVAIRWDGYEKGQIWLCCTKYVNLSQSKEPWHIHDRFDLNTAYLVCLLPHPSPFPTPHLSRPPSPAPMM